MIDSCSNGPASRFTRIVTLTGAGVVALPVVLVPAILALPMSAIFSWLGLGPEYKDLMGKAGQRLKEKVAATVNEKPRAKDKACWTQGMDPGFGVSHDKRLDEAEVFMAYGRFEQTAAIVGGVLRQDPFNVRARRMREQLLESGPDMSSKARRHLDVE